MKVSFRSNYNTYVADLTGAELEVLQKIASKAVRGSFKYVPAQTSNGDGFHVFVVDKDHEGKTIPADFSLEFVAATTQQVAPSVYDAWQAQAKAVKEAA